MIMKMKLSDSEDKIPLQMIAMSPRYRQKGRYNDLEDCLISKKHEQVKVY